MTPLRPSTDSIPTAVIDPLLFSRRRVMCPLLLLPPTILPRLDQRQVELLQLTLNDVTRFVVDFHHVLHLGHVELHHVLDPLLECDDGAGTAGAGALKQ